MNNAEEEISDTQPYENGTQTQSQDVVSQSQPPYFWGQLIPSPNCLRWGISFPVLQLTKDVYTAGRSNDCDIKFNAATVNNKNLQVISKFHFSIRREVINKKNDCVIFLYDNSQNGTFINKKLVGRGNRCVLDNDDVISVSKASLTIWKFMSADVYEKSGLPKTLRNYAALRELGKGACGEVKMIYSKLKFKAFALKIITKPPTTSANITTLMNDNHRIMNEVKILKALQNPFIIKMEDIVDTSSHLYIILELMEGGDLFERISSKKKWSERQTQFIFYQLVQAVNYLHSREITHRDLKPENILLASDDDYPLVKITDFGLSKLVDTHSLMKTFCGTLLYVAPEVLITSGRGAYTKLVDVWSLGVILYTCLARQQPFTTNSPGGPRVEQLIARGKYEFPQRLFAHISREAIDLIKGMMTVDPLKRKTIRLVMIHPWLNDRDIEQQVKNLIRFNNENTSPNYEFNMNNGQRAINSVARNINVYEMVEPLSKKPRLE